MIALALAALLSPLAAAADRAETPPDRLWRLSGEYLYYVPANSGAGLSDQLGALGAGLVAGGYNATDKAISSVGGAGARLTALRRWDARTALGLSLDYVLGPTMNADFHAYSPPVSQGGFGNGGLTINRAATFVRLLAQMRVRLLGRERRRQGDWQLELGSAFGPGVGHTDQTCQASGSLTCQSNSASVAWSGLAWEFGPRASVRLRDVDVGAAVVAAGFPRYKGSTAVAPIEWETLGFALSAEF